MKISSIIPGLLIVLLFSACKKDQAGEGSMTIHFKAVYAGQPLPMFSTVPFTSPQQLQFTHLSFFVSDIALLDQSTAVNLKDIELVDLSYDNMTDADNGYTIHIDNIPAKNYSAIRFGFGVPPDLNAKKPADYPSSHPLSNASDYWVAWDSYIFMKTEGKIDTAGTNNFDPGFAYHTGTDNLYRAFTGTAPILIEDGKNKEIAIVLDYNEVLNGIDIKSKPQNHNPADSVQIAQIVNNLSSALTLFQ
jgi:hypothetical protein